MPIALKRFCNVTPVHNLFDNHLTKSLKLSIKLLPLGIHLHNFVCYQSFDEIIKVQNIIVPDDDEILTSKTV